MDVPGLTRSQLAALQGWAENNTRLLSMIVFGSRARGDHCIDSDLDVSIMLSEEPDETAGWVWYRHHEQWNSELSDLLELEVRLVRPTDEDDGGIAEGLIKDGVLVYTTP